MMEMLKEICRDIFMLEIPLPNNPLRALNCYIIKSGGRSLVIDTGFNNEESRQALKKGLEDLNEGFDSVDVFITHLHSDHCGLAAAMKGEGARVYAGETDGRLINEMTDPGYWRGLESYVKLYDLEKDHISAMDNPGYRYSPRDTVEFSYVREGDRIAAGRYSFEVVDIPGHTPGQVGLYESEHRIFLCGDHILDRITPNIAFWGFEKDMLAVYFENLEKLRRFDIDYLLPAHRNIIRDHRRRIDELLKHHENRLLDIEGIIGSEPLSVRDTAALMHWDLKYGSWMDFPNPQKWFAAGEVMSHLEHLFLTGRAVRSMNDGVLKYKSER
jgi:glyoxylase-like metal-dependent hydrolase (beta-lactamase superfamily II)